MASINKSKTILTNLWFPCILLIVAMFLVSLLQGPKAYAESKKVSGTVKTSSDLERNLIQSTASKPAIPVGELWNAVGSYSSADPEWNNATFFSVWFMENLNFIGHEIVTFKGGDQIFRTVKGRAKALNVHDWTADYDGWFVGGTGKFEGIKGTWKAKTVLTQSENTTEWETRYEIK